MYRFVFPVIFFCFFILASKEYVQAQNRSKFWVYFTDKGLTPPQAEILRKENSFYRKLVPSVTSRALARRAKVRPENCLIDEADIPVYLPYLEKIKILGGSLVHQSRWLNAASFMLPPDKVAVIRQLEFVTRVEPVRAIIQRPREENSDNLLAPYPVIKKSNVDYGSSLAQCGMINVIHLHEIGITGRSVLVGMLDTGFRWKMHESLQSKNVVAEYDFIFHDSVTANQTDDIAGQDSHGTTTMSALGGFKEGQLIGPAYNSDFILGKTEDMRSETKTEEDNWVAAIEWMEMNGVDVVSSSLGYNDFDPAGPSSGDYTWANGDFNGRTTITAIAAVRAARLGVVVCSAMGNEGNGNGITGTILTPADADSIISVGAVGFNRKLASFSSTGPTNDGRFKPDLVSPGVGVYSASAAGPAAYISVSGTSLATPLAAGAAALLISARPELTPIQVGDALRNNADTIDAGRFPAKPNNFTGWGLVNAFKAALSFGPIFSNKPVNGIENNQNLISTMVVSNFGIKPDSVLFYYALNNDTVFSAIPMLLDSPMFFSTSGRYKAGIPLYNKGTQVRFFIEARDSSLHAYRSPAPITGKVWSFQSGETEVTDLNNPPVSFVLRQNYPNPFNSTTKIGYDLPVREHIVLAVYNILGQKVATLVDEFQDSGEAKTRPPVLFDAGNLPSGVYFYRLSTHQFSSVKKMLLLR